LPQVPVKVVSEEEIEPSAAPKGAGH